MNNEGKTDKKPVAVIIDDELAILALGSAMLERIGFEVCSADSGESGVECVLKHGQNIECILLDLTMPGMNGLETLEEIRRVNESAMVYLTSGYDAEDLQSDPRYTFDGFIQKPFTLSSLKEALRS